MLESFRKHWLLVALLAFAFGSAIGGYAGYRSATGTAWIEAVEYDQLLGSDAFRLYESGDSQRARPALAAHLRYLEAMDPVSDAWRPGQHPWLDARTLAFDRMLAAGRLALVEDPVAAESLWLAAAKYAQDAGQSDSSRAAIETTIKRLDAAPAPDSSHRP